MLLAVLSGHLLRVFELNGNTDSILKHKKCIKHSLEIKHRLTTVSSAFNILIFLFWPQTLFYRALTQ